MAVHSPTRKLTYEDFERMPESNRLHEIVDGVLYVTATPFRRHQRLLARLAAILEPYTVAHGLGEILFAPMAVVLSRHDVFEPDLLFVARERAAIVTDKYIEGVPDLVVEILSPGTQRRDRGIKLERYERYGAGEYWLIDPVRDAVTIYRRDGDRFRPPVRLSDEADDRLTSPLFPGLEIALRALFAR